jgi:adenylosuccinate synthase
MGCTVVVGGQYGSEGKGKLVALLSASHEEPWVVRCGGPNSGHTITRDGGHLVLRQVPAAALHPASVLCLAAGCAIDEQVLLDELNLLAIPRERIIVDPRAVIIVPSDREAEKPCVETIGSTSSGTNSAWVRRMSRQHDILLAGTSASLLERVRVEPLAPLLHQTLDNRGAVIVEGTQGFGLSLFHGFDYPFVTGRDTTAAGFITEVGLSPLQVEHIVMVIRTFPIRVGGNSGPLSNEITWEEIQEISGAPDVNAEYTSVTKRLRRVARFDMDSVKLACKYNRPTSLAVMGLDRLDHANYGLRDPGLLTEKAWEFIRRLQRETGVPIEWAGTGFHTEEAIQLPLPIQIHGSSERARDAVDRRHIA